MVCYGGSNLRKLTPWFNDRSEHICYTNFKDISPASMKIGLTTEASIFVTDDVELMFVSFSFYA